MRQSRELSDLISGDFLDAYSAEAVLKESTNYWSEWYARSEAFLHGASIQGLRLADISRGVREEYAAPLEESFKKTEGFVAKIRKEYETKRKLSDGEIDRIFVEHFNGMQGITENSKTSLSLLPFFVYAADRNIPKEELETIKEGIKVAVEMMPYFVNALYRDLNK